MNLHFAVQSSLGYALRLTIGELARLWSRLGFVPNSLTNPKTTMKIIMKS